MFTMDYNWLEKNVTEMSKMRYIIFWSFTRSESHSISHSLVPLFLLVIGKPLSYEHMQNFSKMFHNSHKLDFDSGKILELLLGLQMFHVTNLFYCNVE